MYSPGTLKDSNMISAVYSLFSGVFNGGSVCRLNLRSAQERLQKPVSMFCVNIQLSQDQHKFLKFHNLQKIIKSAFNLQLVVTSFHTQYINFKLKMFEYIKLLWINASLQNCHAHEYIFFPTDL